MSKLKRIPEFKSEAEERAFWESHDSSDYVDWHKAQSASFPNLKLSTKTISLRLPEGFAGQHQDRGQQAGYALPIAYQGLACGRRKGEPWVRINNDVGAEGGT